MVSRREFTIGLLGTGALGLVGATATGHVQIPSEKSEFVRRHTTRVPSEPVIRDGTTRTNGPAYTASVITSEQQANRVFLPGRLPAPSRDEWMNVDFSSYFVACFVSRYAITENGAVRGDQPLTRIDEETFEFVVSVPGGGFDLADGVYTVIEKWERNGIVPESAVVTLRFK